MSNVADTLASLAELVHALDWLEPNYLTQHFDRAATARDMHEVILEFSYAANSKALRDTGDERVHKLLNDILPLTETIRAFFRIDLWPASTAQLQSWTHALSTAPSGKYAFRDNGAIRISLLDADLHGSTLSVRRIWSHVSDVSGSWTEVELKLDAQQVAEFNTRRASLDSFFLPF
ncbi:hypothetical protein [Janthinobacterium sp. J1-1]|uniref:hypothetical protein n=1 Tax=Janthinobacterium sp. J1-1 TaxID=3065910 RepID=UPI002811AB9F|nr:hypothetical protein [Janthinobacterium sp. J1-1]